MKNISIQTVKKLLLTFILSVLLFSPVEVFAQTFSQSELKAVSSGSVNDLTKLIVKYKKSDLDKTVTFTNALLREVSSRNREVSLEIFINLFDVLKELYLKDDYGRAAGLCSQLYRINSKIPYLVKNMYSINSEPYVSFDDFYRMFKKLNEYVESGNIISYNWALVKHEFENKEFTHFLRFFVYYLGNNVRNIEYELNKAIEYSTIPEYQQEYARIGYYSPILINLDFANNFSNSENFQSAREFFNKRLMNDATDPIGYYGRALISFRTPDNNESDYSNKYREIIKNCEKAIYFGIDSLELRLGYVYYILGTSNYILEPLNSNDRKMTIDYMNKYISTNEEDLQGYYMRANMYYEYRSIDTSYVRKARNDYQKVIDNKYNDVDVIDEAITKIKTLDSIIKQNDEKAKAEAAKKEQEKLAKLRTEEVSQLEKRAISGDVDSQYKLGIQLLGDSGYPQDLPGSYFWLKRAQESGYQNMSQTADSPKFNSLRKNLMGVNQLFSYELNELLFGSAMNTGKINYEGIKKPLIIQFHANFAAPSRLLMEKIKKIITRHKELDYYYVELDWSNTNTHKAEFERVGSVASLMGITSVPVLIIINPKSTTIAQISGNAMDETELEKQILKFLKNQ